MSIRSPWLASLLLTLAAGVGCNASPSTDGAPLALEQTIPLPGVEGRIDHLAYDVGRGRLFVAALGNGTVEVVDLALGRPVLRIAGLKSPQGLAFLGGPDELAVASGGDGAVRFYRGGDLAPSGVIALGDDADNLRIQAATGLLVAGHGAGALSVIDAVRQRVVSQVRLPAHPEGFQLDGARAYVNLPDAGVVGVVDLAAGALVASWPNAGRRFNYPLALAPKSDAIAVVYRLPARLVIFDPRTGVERQALETCGDADDLFFDAQRSRIYVVCGAGRVDVFTQGDRGWRRAAFVATSPGARTALFLPGLDRLYVAAPARGGRAAAILVLRPQ